MAGKSPLQKTPLKTNTPRARETKSLLNSSLPPPLKSLLVDIVLEKAGTRTMMV
jgi:hypothetical protein